MKIDAISDLHGYKPTLAGGDILIIAGDLTASDVEREYDDFLSWLCNQDYAKKIIVAGNHDQFLQDNPDWFADRDDSIEYLCDSGTEIEGLKIWGSPYTPWFDGVNPLCSAFMKPDYELEQHWEKIPDDLDILITHGPPWGILDQTIGRSRVINCGSRSLLHTIYHKDPKCHIFGHIHEQGKKNLTFNDTIFLNCSIVNEQYEPVHDAWIMEIG
ncbi:MAG: metallophosphoesterase [Ignavibacteria bacterium]|jgi:Icc-related predicted phosphoesterase